MVGCKVKPVNLNSAREEHCKVKPVNLLCDGFFISFDAPRKVD